jgi:serine/threonine-protein kinase RsbW
VQATEPSGQELVGGDRGPVAPPPGEMVLSVKDDLLVLARLGASTVASRVGFDLEEIDDLRLAVDELCLLVVQGRRTGRLHLAFAADAARIDVWCNYDGSDEPESGPEDDDDDVSVGLSARILDALVDEHGPSTRDGFAGAHLCKYRARTDG